MTEQPTSDIHPPTSYGKAADDRLANTAASRYRLLFERMPDAVAFHRILLDERGRAIDYVFLDVNRAFEKHTGLIRSQVIGRRVTEVIPGIAHDKFDWIGTYGQVVKTGREIRFEQNAETLGRWYAVKAFPTGALEFAVVSEDISAKKQTQERLRQGETRLRTVLRSAPIVMWMVNPSGTLDFLEGCDPSSYDVLPSDAVGRSVFELFAELPELLEDALRALTGEEVHAIRKAHGHTLDMRWAPVRNERGQLTATLGVSIDVTDQRRLQERLEQQHAQMLAMIENMGEAVTVTDPVNHNVLFMNASARSNWGNRVGDTCHSVLHGFNAPCGTGDCCKLRPEKCSTRCTWEGKTA